MSTRTFHYFLDGRSVALLTEAETRTLLDIADEPTTKPVDVPPVVDTKPVITPAPAPILPYTNLEGVGSRSGNGIYTTTELKLLEIYSFKPFTFAPKGTNLEYDLSPGKTRPTGADSDWYGNSAPKDFVPPKGFEVLYFDAEKKQPYYRQITSIEFGSDYELR